MINNRYTKMFLFPFFFKYEELFPFHFFRYTNDLSRELSTFIMVRLVVIRGRPVRQGEARGHVQSPCSSR